MKYLGSNTCSSDSFALGSWEIKRYLGLRMRDQILYFKEINFNNILSVYATDITSIVKVWTKISF